MTRDRGREGLVRLHLHVDGASGIAEDMTLRALIDLEVPVEVIGEALDAVGVGAGG
ncbi:MAG: nickel insertion protein [Kofleriaceae bacterium]